MNFDLDNDTLVIGMPVLDKVHPKTVASLMRINEYTPYVAILMSIEVPIDVGRNQIVKRFLETEHEWLIFIDSDMSFDQYAVMSLLYGDIPPIIGGLCWQRYPPYAPTLINRVPKKENPDFLRNKYRKLSESETGMRIGVDATGAAFLLIHRSVFEKMEEPYFMAIFNEDLTELLCGEDMYFCDKARTLGYKIIVDTSIGIEHAMGIETTVPEVFNKGYLIHGEESWKLLKRINGEK